MTYLQIIIFASWVLCFWLGRRAGLHDGYIRGRKAVRKHYEQVGR